MWKRNFKTLFMILVILLGLNLFACEEESLDLDVEDNPYANDEIQIKRRIIHEEEDEFDNPHLLNQQVKRGAASKVQGEASIPLPHQAIPQPESIPYAPQESDKKLHFAFYEIVMCVFVISFILNCLWGKKNNESYAQKWYESNKQFMEDNYAHIGVNTEYSTKTVLPLLKESYNNFKFYASGRKFTKWLLVNMEFKRRQDLVSLASSLFLLNEKDRVIYESSIIPVGDLPLVFCLCKKKDVKTMKKSYTDIDFFTQPYNPNFLSDNLIFLTENDEIFNSMFSNKEFVSCYHKIESYIDIIYFTDRQTYSKEEHSIFFSFDITSSKANLEELFQNLTLFVHMFIDLLSSAKVSSNHKKEAERLRVDFDKVRAKELQERNAEETRQKKLEKMTSKTKKNLTVEQAQKLEEKEKKEQLKIQKKKQMKVVKK